MAYKNVYIHTIDLKSISIPNTERSTFAQQIVELPYRGYEVEQCQDGRKVVITKPGGKNVYGRPKKEDIMVFIFNPSDESLWQITHQQILDDVVSKCKEDAIKGKKFIILLRRTLEGEEPNDFLNEILELQFNTGEQPEELIKAYKWIWGQEDVNYPNKKGRYLSWEPYEELLKGGSIN